jgi:hypothetical protein
MRWVTYSVIRKKTSSSKTEYIYLASYAELASLHRYRYSYRERK